MSELIEKAKQLATKKHAHLHLYNEARSPAIHHIAEVATLVEQNGGSDDMICAAWLHDIIEDTDVHLRDIEELFGKNIAAMVDGLTDPPDYATLPLSIRKQKQSERLKNKSSETKLIKICDQLSNVERVTNDPPTDWNHQKKLEYCLGTKQVVDACLDTNNDLEKRFNDAFEKAKRKYRP